MTMESGIFSVSRWRWQVHLDTNGVSRILLIGRRAMDKLNIGADQAKRWRDQALRGRRRRLSRNLLSRALILMAIIILCGLIALKAYK
jgi:hypothetical protein